MANNTSAQKYQADTTRNWRECIEPKHPQSPNWPLYAHNSLTWKVAWTCLRQESGLGRLQLIHLWLWLSWIFSVSGWKIVTPVATETTWFLWIPWILWGHWHPLFFNQGDPRYLRAQLSWGFRNRQSVPKVSVSLISSYSEMNFAVLHSVCVVFTIS